MTRFRFHRDEDGMALMTALLAVVILSGLVIVFMSRAVSESRFSANSRDHETAIHVAEAAADKQMSFVHDDNNHVTADRDGLTVAVDPGSISDEEAWAIGLLDSMRPDSTGNASDAWLSTATGESFAVRPYDTSEAEPLKVVYGVGAVPGFDAPNAKVRVIKLRIDQDNYIPEFALLTGASLTFGGNAAIIVPGCDTSTPELAQTTCIADVHTNGTFTNPGGASTIEGRVSQSNGTCPADANAVNGCVDAADGVADKPIPEFSARDFYNRNVELNPDPEGQTVEWFDLCPPGKPAAQATVREPGAEPCLATSEQIWPDPALSPTDFRGWKWQANQWQSSAVGAGVFYIYHADAKVTGSSGSSHRAVSVLVEQNPAAKASTGTLEVTGNPRLQSALQSVLIMTDADLDMQGTPGGTCGVVPEAYSGFIGVGEQLKTQGTVAIRGAIIVRDKADDHPKVKRNNDGIGGTMCFEFDENLEIDFSGLWVITYWNEL